jgi:hypothetical protein
MKNVKLCFLMMFAAAICGLVALPAAAVSTSNRPDGSEPAAAHREMGMFDGDTCIVPCPPGATIEQESCGEDKNNGCNMTVPAFEPITIGQTICGTAWSNSSLRDTDWYQIIITAPMKLIFIARAEFPVRIFLIYAYDGNQPISCINKAEDDTNTAPACTDVQVSRDCQPGTYWLWVGDRDWSENPCGSSHNNYVATLKTPYCDARGSCDEYISNVLVGNINNSSGCSGYADYTALSTEMTVGGAYPITVTNGILYYPQDQCGIWVDWNQDGDFDDPCEAITVSGTPGVGPYTATIVPPLNAAVGGSRMRIRITYTGVVSPCGDTTYGEVEDYTIIVSPYCQASGGCDEYISNVLVGDINNSSGCDGYADYTALSTKMVIDDAYPITVTNGNPIYLQDQCGIWVDWNQDSDFDDPCEAIQVSGTPGVGPYTAVITPPLNAKIGNTRMRIRIAYMGEVSPCGHAAYGEVEDYTITVEPNADLNRDGIVDFKDFAFFANQWLTTGP